MNLTQITPAQFKQIATLLDKKEALQAKITKIDAQLSAFEDTSPAPTIAKTPGRKKRKVSAATKAKMAASQQARRAKKEGTTTPVVVPTAPTKKRIRRPAKAKRAARGALKTSIIDLVKASGKSGITIKDIASKLGLSYNRAFAWFKTTGKNVKEIQKVGPGKHAWIG